MNSYLSPLAQSLVPYVPGEQPTDRRYIKLNTNENPYPPSPAVAPAVEQILREGSLRKYSRPECEPLRELVARQQGFPSRDYVYFANGSDEVLAFCFAAFFAGRKEPVRFADITYSFYPVYCDLFSIPYRKVPLREDFTLSVADYEGPGGGIIIANPNAPTALALAEDELRGLIASHPQEVVLVDEAYAAFSRSSCAAWVMEYPNLIVTRTLSKSHALAGLRVGYCMAQPHLIEGVVRVKNSFNSYSVDALAQAAAYQALDDQAYHQEMTDRVIATRNRFMARLRQMGFYGPDSQANFIFAAHPRFSGAHLAAALRQEGILVRHFAQPERIEPYLRITIGTDGEMEQVAAALERILACGEEK